MIDTLLVLNTGSSSLKFQVFRLDDLDVLMQGKVADIGGAAALAATLADGEKLSAEVGGNDHDAALAAVMTLVDRHDDDWRTKAVVHRIVHGGTRFADPVIVTPEIEAELRRLVPLAPLHQPHNLAGLDASNRLAPDALDIACFDTAFHAGHSEVISSFAIEKDFRDKGIRRYGFHGLSYEWIAHALRKQHPSLYHGRVVAAHLGLLRRSRSQQARRLIEIMQSREERPTLLLGDLNEWRLGERSSLNELVPAFHTLPVPVPSFPSGLPLLALDRIIANRPEILSDFEVHDTPLARTASDHLPIKAYVDPSLPALSLPAAQDTDAAIHHAAGQGGLSERPLPLPAAGPEQRNGELVRQAGARLKRAVSRTLGRRQSGPRS